MMATTNDGVYYVPHYAMSTASSTPVPYVLVNGIAASSMSPVPMGSYMHGNSPSAKPYSPAAARSAVDSTCGPSVTTFSIVERTAALRICVGAALDIAEQSVKDRTSDQPLVMMTGARALQAYVLPELRLGAVPTDDVDLHVYATSLEEFNAVCKRIEEECILRVHKANLPESIVMGFSRVRTLETSPGSNTYVELYQYSIDLARPHATRAVDVLYIHQSLHQANQEYARTALGTSGAQLAASTHPRVQFSKCEIEADSRLRCNVIGPANCAQDQDRAYNLYVEPVLDLCANLWRTVNDVTCYRRQKDEGRRRLLRTLAEHGYISSLPLSVCAPFVGAAGAEGLELDHRASCVAPLPPAQRLPVQWLSRSSENTAAQWKASMNQNMVTRKMNESMQIMLNRQVQQMERVAACHKRAEAMCRKAIECANRWKAKAEKSRTNEIELRTTVQTLRRKLLRAQPEHGASAGKVSHACRRSTMTRLCARCRRRKQWSEQSASDSDTHETEPSSATDDDDRKLCRSTQDTRRPCAKLRHGLSQHFAATEERQKYKRFAVQAAKYWKRFTHVAECSIE